jgi:hypothetical protein
MKLKEYLRAERAAFVVQWRNFLRSPGLGHAALGIVITLMVGGFLALVPVGPWGAGAVAAFIFYMSRERRQSEEHFGSNRIWPWQWKPRAGRDIAWPALAAALVALLIEVLA